MENFVFHRLQGTKKGVPLYSNLVNLKSNTMKNTVQSYDISTRLTNNLDGFCLNLIFFNKSLPVSHSAIRFKASL